MSDKYSGPLTEQLYRDVILCGFEDAAVGSVDEDGVCVALIRAQPGDDVAWPAGTAGAIITEDSYGFIYGDLYATETELMEAWRVIEDAI